MQRRCNRSSSVTAHSRSSAWTSSATSTPLAASIVRRELRLRQPSAATSAAARAVDGQSRRACAGPNRAPSSASSSSRAARVQRAGQRPRARRVSGDRPRQLAPHLAQHVFGERAMRRELAADDRVQAARRAVPANQVTARDRSRGAARLIRQRPNAGMRVQHAAASPAAPGNTRSVSRDEIVELARIDRGGGRLAFESLVGRADQQQPVPRQNEQRPPVAAGLDVHADRAARPETASTIDVAALGAADQPRVLDRPEHLVDPRPRGVHDQRRRGAADDPVGGAPLDADRAPAPRRARASRAFGLQHGRRTRRRRARSRRRAAPGYATCASK